VVRKSVRKPARFSRRLNRLVRRGDRVRNIRLAKVMPWSGRVGSFSKAVVGAVVVMVRVEVAVPLDGVTEDGAKVQVAPAGRVPQENFTVPV
jgi:hypothetical protein